MPTCRNDRIKILNLGIISYNFKSSTSNLYTLLEQVLLKFECDFKQVRTITVDNGKSIIKLVNMTDKCSPLNLKEPLGENHIFDDLLDDTADDEETCLNLEGSLVASESGFRKKTN